MTKAQVEVITSVERRRRWSRAEKERIVAAAIEPGAVGPFADRLWREKEAAKSGPFETDAAEEQVYLEIQKLSPHANVSLTIFWRDALFSGVESGGMKLYCTAMCQ